MKFIKQLTWKKALKFIMWTLVAWVIIEFVESLIQHYWHVEMSSTDTVVGFIMSVIILGFKLHIWCCVFPGLYATYRMRHKKCHHDHCDTSKNRAYFYPITLKRIAECFYQDNEHKYLGISWNIFIEGTEPYVLLNDFIKFVDSKAKPRFVPRFVLNLLHLFGNDNSIVKCRSQRISGWLRRMTNGIMITDIKEKYGTLRVYGSFTKEIQEELYKLEKKINPFLEAY